MSTLQHFRSAFNGFNRDDVVHYIEFMNNQHKQEVAQLQRQLEIAQTKAMDTTLATKLNAAEARCAQLEAELEALRAATPAAPDPAESELEAYRRAERAERLAQERAQQIYAQANAVLADATLKTESASSQVTAVADEITAKLQATKVALQEAVALLYAVRPEK